MSYKAVLFGSIGTLAETSDLQRDAFNEAFKISGLDWFWDEDIYRKLLSKSGGTSRINAVSYTHLTLPTTPYV